MTEVSTELLIAGIIGIIVGLSLILKPKAIYRFVLKKAAKRQDRWTGSLPTEKDRKRWVNQIEWGVVDGKTNHMFGCGVVILLLFGLGILGLGIMMLVIYFKG